jgi:AcrR family transcriptional regulator
LEQVQAWRVARERRTQAERTATTRGALLDATVGCLVEQGYRATTTTEVARRAGVSLGALLHHFPTKIDLLCAAVGHLFVQRDVEFRAAVASLPQGDEREDAAIDLLWSVFQGPTFVAWLELWVAARNDPELAAAVVRLDSDFGAAAEASFAELFPDETSADPRLARTALGLLFGLMEGLALSRLLPGYEPCPADDVLALLKQLIRPGAPVPEGSHP